jgi:hypothetical protein
MSQKGTEISRKSDKERERLEMFKATDSSTKDIMSVGEKSQAPNVCNVRPISHLVHPYLLVEQ